MNWHYVLMITPKNKILLKHIKEFSHSHKKIQVSRKCIKLSFLFFLFSHSHHRKGKTIAVDPQIKNSISTLYSFPSDSHLS